MQQGVVVAAVGLVEAFLLAGMGVDHARVVARQQQAGGGPGLWCELLDRRQVEPDDDGVGQAGALRQLVNQGTGFHAVLLSSQA